MLQSHEQLAIFTRLASRRCVVVGGGTVATRRITSYNVCYTKLLRKRLIGAAGKHGVELVDVTPMLEFFREQDLVLGTEIISQADWPSHPANPFPEPDRALLPWSYHSYNFV